MIELAADQRERAIGIVLSGTDHDAAAAHHEHRDAERGPPHVLEDDVGVAADPVPDAPFEKVPVYDEELVLISAAGHRPCH